MIPRVLYAGPPLSGRTTTLTEICARAPSSVTRTRRQVRFGPTYWLEATLSAGDRQLALVATPGAVYHPPLREEVARVADAIVFVVDSQHARVEASRASIEEVAASLARAGRELASVPVVLSYNKRDLPTIASIEELERELNAPRWPFFETVATVGRGIMPPLSLISRAVLGTDILGA